MLYDTDIKSYSILYELPFRIVIKQRPAFVPLPRKSDILSPPQKLFRLPQNPHANDSSGAPRSKSQASASSAWFTKVTKMLISASKAFRFWAFWAVLLIATASFVSGSSMASDGFVKTSFTVRKTSSKNGRYSSAERNRKKRWRPRFGDTFVFDLKTGMLISSTTSRSSVQNCSCRTEGGKRTTSEKCRKVEIYLFARHLQYSRLPEEAFR